jgi:hypothetical protein
LLKIIAHLMGGIGNQLFQYAAGRALMERNPGSKLFWFFEDHYPLANRAYALTPLEIKAEKAQLTDLRQIGPERGVRRKVLSWLGRPIEENVFREKRTFIYDPTLLERQTDTYLIGFWQSFKYLDSIRDSLRVEFKSNPEGARWRSCAEEISRWANPIAVHIRRADYLQKSSGFQPLPIQYYNQAIALMLNAIVDPVFFFFTDDVEWLRNEFMPTRDTLNSIVVSDGRLKDYEELLLMARCKHHIIANSSFSWWGAWLGVHPEQRVVAPRSWNGVDETIPLVDLIPPSWTLL